MSLSEQWNAIRKLDPRQKYQQIQALTHQIISTDFIDNIDASEIDLGIEIINRSAKLTGDPQKYARGRSLLIAKKLALTGDDQAEILSKRSGQVATESGTISIGDPNLEPSLGQRLCFGTGGDGTFDVQLRLIKATEPVLTPKEYKLMVAATDTLILNIPSGTISVGDLSLSDKDFCIQTKPGNYKVCAYLFDSHRNFRSFYIVCTQTSLPALDHSEQIFTLE